ncbi:hypothetical protein K438DRAFT_1816733 [Mycena galopus ATCC 62051]|nr:hypothetical protein K438DRAFT_1816733 [Mycena galopus ATCC 62051]
MVPQKPAFGPHDSQIEMVGRVSESDYPSAQSGPTPPNNAWREKPTAAVLRRRVRISSGWRNSATLSDSDPSSFTKDPALVQSFYGIAYTPEGSQMPDCGNSLDDVITDIQRIRLYGMMSFSATYFAPTLRISGADCNQTELCKELQLEAINRQGQHDVWLGNYAVATDNGAAYKRQRGGSRRRSKIGNAGAAILIADINDTRSMMSDLSLSNVAIGTSDADTDLKAAAAVSNTPQMYIAETGIYDSADSASGSNGASIASEANLQAANQNGTKYFFFEYFDEKWKDEQFGGVEGHWGLFYQNRTLKGITIPTCD